MELTTPKVNMVYPENKPLAQFGFSFQIASVKKLTERSEIQINF